ncbi:diaminopimelate epimerase [Lyticum sinuosum]|uniref:Bifunctional protein GlmU n=1 Tax=Lyticum sinuosum TaxID=1332059 RepID=A0AAE5AHH2_9RICK|nr:diaminopimelate epimerase [Lyticum sinuosum]MDZ5761565.1 putative fused GlmU and DapF protein [Lyticum sinuosum]
MSKFSHNQYKIIPIILSGGRGTRMNSNLPKVLHKIANKHIISYVLDAIKYGLKESFIDYTAIVVNSDIINNQEFNELLSYYPELKIQIINQEESNGTGDAVLCAIKYGNNAIDSKSDDKTIGLVLYGDVPFIRPEDINIMLEKVYNGAQLVGAFFTSENPFSYGRVEISNNHIKIVEDNECSEEQKKNKLCNAGMIACNYSLLKEFVESYKYHLSDYLNEIQYINNSTYVNNLENVEEYRENQNNSSEKIKSFKEREFYLTDIYNYASRRNALIDYIKIQEEKVIGINTLYELIKAEEYIQSELRIKFLNLGVKLILPNTIMLSYDTKIGKGTIIEPNVIIGPNVSIGEDCQIKSNSVLTNCTIESKCLIGPFAHIRYGTKIGDQSRIGSFVETKNAELENNVKAPHLSYLGDVKIGSDSNIGAGTIICNYDGKQKHKSFIGKNAFIGSNSSIISPRIINNNTKIGAGSVITEDIPEGYMALARNIQVNKKMNSYNNHEKINIENNTIKSNTDQILEKNTNFYSYSASNRKVVNFYKMHGSGNDILIIDIDDNNEIFPENRQNLDYRNNYHSKSIGEEIALLCDRNLGIGCDQIILVSNIKNDSANISIYNNDGSEALTCGNGMRCLGLWIFIYKQLKYNKILFLNDVKNNNLNDKINQNGILFNWHLKNRSLTTNLLNIQTKSNQIGISGDVIAEMGEFRFREVVLELPIKSNGVYHVSIANDHLVIVLDNEKDCDMNLAASLSVSNILFPYGVNVSFMIIDPKHDYISIKTWERGVKQQTMSCGSASAACHIAALMAKFITKDEIIVKNIGGNLISKVSNRDISIYGPATMVFSGEILI